MPAPPGFTGFRPSPFVECFQQCDPNTPQYGMGHGRAAGLAGPAVDLRHQLQDPAHVDPVREIGRRGDHVHEPARRDVRIPLYGPCWHVALGNASVDCSGPRPVLTIAAHESVDLHGTVWARQGFVQSGAPLAQGRYTINMGDRRSETLGYTAAEATWIDVT